MQKPIEIILSAKRYAPTTINRALISLMLFFDPHRGHEPVSPSDDDRNR